MLVLILGRVRDIRMFADKSALMNQISQDINECRKIYGEVMNGESTKSFTKRAEEIYSLHEKFTPKIINLT